MGYYCPNCAFKLEPNTDVCPECSRNNTPSQQIYNAFPVNVPPPANGTFAAYGFYGIPPPIHNTPSAYNTLQAFGTPQGYGNLQDYGTPQGYGTSQGDIPPLAYAPPPAYTTPPAYPTPQAYTLSPYITPPAYITPQAYPTLQANTPLPAYAIPQGGYFRTPVYAALPAYATPQGGYFRKPAKASQPAYSTQRARFTQPVYSTQPVYATPPAYSTQPTIHNHNPAANLAAARSDAQFVNQLSENSGKGTTCTEPRLDSASSEKFSISALKDGQRRTRRD